MRQTIQSRIATPLRRGVIAAGALLAAAAGQASATWSILIADVRTGEVAVASATCVTGIDLRAETPVLLAGIGGVTAQSFVDVTGQNRTFARDGLLAGRTPQQIIDGLSTFDSGHQTRQYGIVDVRGGAATFSGLDASEWKGGRTGRVGDLVYAVQGNILTGPNVVDDAVDAIINTPGDIPEKLMAAMEAAEDAGGDGRCSCTTGGPESCGSPPPEPFKSATVGYMLIARAGDTDRCQAVYALTRRPSTIVSADLDADGTDEVVAFAQGFNEGRVYRAVPGASPRLEQVQLLTPGTTGVVDAEIGDVTGDGLPDLVFHTSRPQPQIRVYVGTGDPQQPFLEEQLGVDISAGNAEIALGEFDAVPGLDIAAAVTTRSLTIIPGGSPLGAAVETPLPAQPTALEAADLVGDARDDLAIGYSDGTVSVLENTLGSFATEAESGVFEGGRVEDIALVDADADGVTDLVAVTGDFNAGELTIVGRGPGAARSSTTLAGSPRDIEPFELDGTGRIDFAISSFLQPTISLVRQNDDDTLEVVDQTSELGGARTRAAAIDLNGDALGDLVTGADNTNGGLATIIGNPAGVALDRGCANGDYFMELNVANSGTGGADPVDILRLDFDAWRDARRFDPDAVRSLVRAPARVVPGTPFEVRVDLRDFQGGLVNADAWAFALASGSEGSAESPGFELLEVGPAGGSSFTLLVRADRVGAAELRVALDGPQRSVELMPARTVRVVDQIADFDGDGAATIFDVIEYLGLFSANDPAADLDGDTFFTIADVLILLSAFDDA